MRKTIATLAIAGAAIFGFVSPAAAQNSGVAPNGQSVLGLDASSALHWQICDVSLVSAIAAGHNCDNSDHINYDRHGNNSGVYPNGQSVIGADVSDLAHWQICDVSAIPIIPAGHNCNNQDHINY